MSALLDTQDRRPTTWSQTEIDHRIANSLSMIAALVRVQSSEAGRGRTLSPGECQNVLTEVAGRIEAVARLHRSLARTPDGELEAGDYLRDIGHLAQHAFDPDKRIAFTYDIEAGALLPPARLSALGLLVNEAVVNAIKYSHPAGVGGNIRIVCRPMFGDGLMVMVEDDGVGLPDDFDTDENGGGLGFRIMRSLAEQLETTLHFRSSPLGLTVQVVLTL